ncbi:dihydropteroate synthase [Chryseomicrobium excrementi]|uniref:Dihydropteroate synthase n=1 Tax=Chryseomicrobium excrementi TaxID=2041346 RepID=A0A2M9EWT7_9BACL|nr:dihydropteroate synthase [Chryseomicrobium excrementi]PJK15658.1 dihydropteroate synthase [Chryseomicrobium excrementi]
MTKVWTAHGVTLDFSKETVVMGILNVTPDSFSDGGLYNNVEQAVERTREMVEQGAKIVDIGGESTRPGYTRISDEEEIGRVVPVIRAIREAGIPVFLSIDTYKSAVAKAALDAGVDILNDIWGVRKDPAIARLAAEYKAPLILMHNRETADYKEFWHDAKADLEESLAIAKRHGVEDEQIWLDPGIGFGKNTTHNIWMMQHLPQLVEMGYPVLLATSRKSLIGNVLKLPVEERLEGTAATVSYGIDKGVHLVRVHDVKEMTRTTRMMDILVGKTDYVEEV